MKKKLYFPTSQEIIYANRLRENYYTRKEIKKWLKGGKIHAFKR